jgi:hypothetical protein
MTEIYLSGVDEAKTDERDHFIAETSDVLLRFFIDIKNRNRTSTLNIINGKSFTWWRRVFEKGNLCQKQLQWTAVSAN